MPLPLLPWTELMTFFLGWEYPHCTLRSVFMITHPIHAPSHCGYLSPSTPSHPWCLHLEFQPLLSPTNLSKRYPPGLDPQIVLFWYMAHHEHCQNRDANLTKVGTLCGHTRCPSPCWAQPSSESFADTVIAAEQRAGPVLVALKASVIFNSQKTDFLKLALNEAKHSSQGQLLLKSKATQVGKCRNFLQDCCYPNCL